MIDCILATDMSHHFREYTSIKQKLDQNELKLEDDKDRLKIIKFAFHLADISNPVKKWELSVDWTNLLYFEFFAQGDLERQQNFEISKLFDRYTTNIAKS